MLEFHQPTLADRDWATKCYRASGKLGCENTFLSGAGGAELPGSET